MIDTVFGFCVWILIQGAAALGITYQEINVYIFCIIWPILSIGLFLEILRLRRKLNHGRI
jgi:nitrate reductase NapE component